MYSQKKIVALAMQYCRQLQARGDVAIAVCWKVSVELKTLRIRREEGTSTAAATDLQERLKETPVIETVTIV